MQRDESEFVQRGRLAAWLRFVQRAKDRRGFTPCDEWPGRTGLKYCRRYGAASLPFFKSARAAIAAWVRFVTPSFSKMIVN
jgi:hypothetical protein